MTTPVVGPPTAPPDPLVVIVAYHSAPELRGALAPLEGLDVLVVDNSSSSAVASAAHDHGARYTDTGANLGFARGVNEGIRQAAGRHVVLVNPDAVVSADTVRSLVAGLEGAGRVAAASPALRHDDGSWQRVRWPYPTPTTAWFQAVGLRRDPPDVDGYLTGAVLALSAGALAELGGFDPSFFLYAEETDWQRRARAAGWSVGLREELVATHIGGTSSTSQLRRQVHFHAGLERYVRKWHGSRGWHSFRAAVLLGAVVRSVVLPGERGRVARHRAGLYRKGPLRCERALPRA